MPGFLPDSNCLIAVVSPWHAHHLDAQAEIGRRLDRGETMFLAAPSLLEAYSVLTRVPVPYRIRPAEAAEVLEANFLTAGTVVALDAPSYRALLERAARQGIAGGRVYDAVLAACAERSGVDTLLTFNEGHLSRLTDPRIAIVVPGR